MFAPDRLTARWSVRAELTGAMFTRSVSMLMLRVSMAPTRTIHFSFDDLLVSAIYLQIFKVS
jgi:hypothetical protein